jgi:magnesium transporter
MGNVIPTTINCGSCEQNLYIPLFLIIYMLKAFSAANGKIREVKPDSRTKNFVWIDCSSPTNSNIEFVTKKLGISKEELRSDRDPKERPRIEVFDKFTLIIFKTPYKEKNTTKTVSFPIYVGQNFIITIHNHEISAIQKLKADAMKGSAARFSSKEYFLMRLLDNVQNEYFTLLDEIEKDIDNLEHKAISKADKKTLSEIFKTKKMLIYFRNALTTNREIISGIERETVPQISKTQTKIFRPLYDDITQLIDMETTYRDILTGTLDIYMSSVSNNMNIVVKKMTAYGSLILVPTLISGIYGMNFRFMPELQWQYGYYFALLMMLFSVVGLFIYFDKKDWL